jgi:predicted esterase
VQLITEESKKTPLLICHGIDDDQIKYAKSQRIHDVLGNLGVVSTLRLFEEQGHHSSDQEWEEVQMFIQKCIGGSV